jgi:diguanylate cyclase (GGDEF)-like protein
MSDTVHHTCLRPRLRTRRSLKDPTPKSHGVVARFRTIAPDHATMFIRQDRGNSKSKQARIDLAACSRLPTLPTVAIEILEVFDSVETPIEVIVDIIQRDPAITSKILQTSNSASLAPANRIADLKVAVIMLGKRAITPLVLSFCLAREAMAGGEAAQHFQDFWLSAFIRSTTASLICGARDQSMASEAATVSLLSGIGRLALLRHQTTTYLEILERAAADLRPVHEVERDTLGFTHVELSVAMLKHTRLADRVLPAIQHQLDPVPALERLSPVPLRRLALVVAAAREMSQLLLDRDPGIAYVRLTECLSGLEHPDAAAPEHLFRRTCETINRTRSAFDIQDLRLPDPQELVQRALEQLSQYSLALNAAEPPADVPQQLLQENGHLKRRVADLICQATTDPLTGVNNRSHLIALRNEVVEFAHAQRESLGMLVVDIDHFKKLNDRYGHPVGDQVLREIATILRTAIRTRDVIGRYGGEEFVVLVAKANGEVMNIVAERVRAAVESHLIFVQDRKVPVTVSLGGSYAIPDGSSAFADRLFSAADEALYEAKHSGRNRAVIRPLITSAAADGEPVDAGDALAAAPCLAR